MLFLVFPIDGEVSWFVNSALWIFLIIYDYSRDMELRLPKLILFDGLSTDLYRSFYAFYYVGIPNIC